MAQVAHRPRSQPDIDYHLDYQFRQWESVPEVATQWPTLAGVDREVFHLEWVGITESRLRELRQWAAQGLLTPVQQTRYEALSRLVARHRPLLDQLLAG